MATKDRAAPASAGGGLEPKHARALLEQMLLIRRFEEKAAEMYALGKIGGFLHLYIGEEAVAVGAVSVLRPDDYVIAGYREHGHALAKGVDPRRIMAELFGRRDGVSKGRGGSMHIADVSKGNLGANGIVGGGIPIAVGAALSAKKQKNGKVVVSFFGDGANNEGAFHEALNMAAVWKLPVVFVCENNGYGMSTSTKRSTAVENVADRAAAAVRRRPPRAGGLRALQHRGPVRKVGRGLRRLLPSHRRCPRRAGAPGASGPRVIGVASVRDRGPCRAAGSRSAPRGRQAGA